MRRFFEPVSAPPWLKTVLTSIRQALGDIFDTPIRPFQAATADLPSASDWTGGWAWDNTLTSPVWSNGSAWKAPYYAGGTDVALADGGTGASLADPNADRIMFWDDSAAQVTWLVPNTGLSISGTDLNVTVTQYTDEAAQDAVGTILADTATIDLTYNDATPSITADVKDGSITYAKMQDVSAASKLLGRGDSGSGDPQEITLGTGLSMSGTTLNSTDGLLVGVQIITATGSGTYTPTSGTTSVVIELVGAGGGGGGCVNPGASNGATASGGGAGGYLRKRLTANFSGASYSVGAKGTGGAAGNNNGTAGGNTTFTDTAGSPTTYTAAGGALGAGSGVAATGILISPAAAGGTATNGDINMTGGQSHRGLVLATTAAFSAAGGTGPYAPFVVGSRIGANASSAGNAGVGKGGGGAGAVGLGTGGSAAGGDGSDGMIIIWEYS